MNKKKWIITAIVLLVCIGLGTYNLLRSGTQVQEDEMAPPSGRTQNILNVNAQIIRQQPMTDVIYTSGSLLPDEEVDLSFETSGKIVAINFQEGSLVKKGDLLAKVNDAPLQAQLQRYESQVKLAENRVYRQNALLAKDAVSQEAYEQVRTDLATLQADIALVKANIAQTELRAPFDGIIGLRNVSEGAYASPSVVVATLTKISPLKLDFFIPERYAGQIRKGTRLTFQVEGQLRSFDATVYATESQVDVSTRNLAVRAVHPNNDQRLTPGRYANVTIKMQEIPNAIAIPTEAIISEMGINKVFLYKNGVAEPVEVKTGLRTDALLQIVEGLTPGDTLITSGMLQLRTGMKVKLDTIE